MYLGHKYNVAKCVEDCITFLKRTLHNGNVCTALFYANLYDQTELLELCKTHIISYTEGVFESPGFLNCDRKVLEYILGLDYVSCSEDKVFEACMAWVKIKSNQNVLSKEVVGDLLYKFRFASMTIQQLCALQKEYDLVLSSDFITIANIIVGQPGIKVDRFSTTPRQIKWNKYDVIQFDRKTKGNFYPFDLYANYRTTLSSNIPVVLGSFACAAIVIADGCGGHNLDWNLTVEVKITETSDYDDEVKVISNMTASLGSTMTKLLLPQPILIRPGFLYTICLGPFPCEHQYRTQLLKRKMRLTANATIEIHDNQDNDAHSDYEDEDDDDAFGMISELDFNMMSSSIHSFCSATKTGKTHAILPSIGETSHNITDPDLSCLETVQF